MYKVKSDFDTDVSAKYPGLMGQRNKNLASRDRIQSDMINDYKIPPTFKEYMGMKGKLYLPNGVKPEILDDRVNRFEIGSKTFEYVASKRKYISEDGTEYSVPEVDFQTPKFEFVDEVPKMEAKVSVSNAQGSDGLQMIQTIYTRGKNEFTETMASYKMNSIKDEKDQTQRLVFVDGAKNSPPVLLDKNNKEIPEEEKRKPSHELYPYYYTKENLSNTEKSGMQWDRVKGEGSIILYDKPSATTSRGLFELNRFETSAIIENWLGTGTDLIIGTFTWACVTPPKGGRPNTNFMGKTVEITEPSAQHLEIIELDYPEYAKQKLLPKK